MIAHGKPISRLVLLNCSSYALIFSVFNRSSYGVEIDNQNGYPVVIIVVRKPLLINIIFKR